MKIATKIILLIITVISIACIVGAIYFYNPALDISNQNFEMQNKPLAEVRAGLEMTDQEAFAKILGENPEFRQYVVDEVLNEYQLDNLKALEEKVERYDELRNTDGELSDEKISSIIEAKLSEETEEISREIAKDVELIVAELESDVNEKIKSQLDSSISDEDLKIVTETIDTTLAEALDKQEIALNNLVKSEIKKFEEVNFEEFATTMENTIAYEMIEMEESLIQLIDQEVKREVEKIKETMVCPEVEESAKANEVEPVTTTTPEPVKVEPTKAEAPVVETKQFVAPEKTQVNTFTIDEYKKVREANKAALFDLINK